MKPKRTTHNQESLFESCLSQILSPSHHLRILADIIDWKQLEKDLANYFANAKGTPGST